MLIKAYRCRRCDHVFDSDCGPGRLPNCPECGDTAWPASECPPRHTVREHRRETKHGTVKVRQHSRRSRRKGK